MAKEVKDDNMCLEDKIRLECGAEMEKGRTGLLTMKDTGEGLCQQAHRSESFIWMTKAIQSHKSTSFNHSKGLSSPKMWLVRLMVNRSS